MTGTCARLRRALRVPGFTLLSLDRGSFWTCIDNCAIAFNSCLSFPHSAFHRAEFASLPDPFLSREVSVHADVHLPPGQKSRGNNGTVTLIGLSVLRGSSRPLFVTNCRLEQFMMRNHPVAKVHDTFHSFVLFLFLMTKSWHFEQGCVDFL